MSTYREAPAEVSKLGDDVKKKAHKPLCDAGVTVCYLFAHAKRDNEDQPKGPALKHHGYPAAAVIKINSLEDRVAGLPDVTIKVDGDRWEEWSDQRRRALLDHEWQHAELVMDDEGGITLDDASRPKLKLRLHDTEIGGFDDIVRRHGGEAFEAQAFAETHRRWVQQGLFPGE